ncbi:hypothetical protein GCM10009104_15520 [Marinobacterium maritimum]|uniref:Uncharacterized protein n=1 Tax=Marinobacterium maritimum TaxID=500162 RepID=A0ABP3TCB3_9GAMM
MKQTVITLLTTSLLALPMAAAAAEQARDADAATELVGRIGLHSKQSHESLRKDCDD